MNANNKFGNVEKCKGADRRKRKCSHYEYWIIITWLTLMLLGIIFLIIERAHRMPFFRKTTILKYI